MEREYVSPDQILAVVHELDMAVEELLAKSRSGNFAPYTFLSDDDETPLFKVREVFQICQLWFGAACAQRMREAWQIALPQPKRRRRRKSKQESVWLKNFGGDGAI